VAARLFALEYVDGLRKQIKELKERVSMLEDVIRDMKDQTSYYVD
jgi:cell division protein FtsB